MSITLAVLAAVLVTAALAAAVYAAKPSLFHGPAPEDQRPSPRPCVRSVVPQGSTPPPAKAWQHPDVQEIDLPSWPLSILEGRLFDQLVEAHDFLPEYVRPEHMEGR